MMGYSMYQSAKGIQECEGADCMAYEEDTDVSPSLSAIVSEEMNLTAVGLVEGDFSPEQPVGQVEPTEEEQQRIKQTTRT